MTAVQLRKIAELGSNRTALNMAKVVRRTMSKSLNKIASRADVGEVKLLSKVVATMIVSYSNEKGTPRVNGVRFVAKGDWLSVVDRNGFFSRREIDLKPSDFRRLKRMSAMAQEFLMQAGCKSVLGSEQVQLCLDEFSFRFATRRTKPEKQFLRLLESSIQHS